jgi:CheY-like chemotaxis protein
LCQAHEIRTPLHQVTRFVDLLDQTPLDKEQKSFVGMLKSSAQGLMTVINDVLDYSKLEAGHMKLENVPFEPLAVAKGSIEAVWASCDERHLWLRLDWDTQIPFKLKSDPNRLRQILLNLLSNAIKFTKEGGITLKVTYVGSVDRANDSISNNKPHQPMIKFAVNDTGIGISKEQKNIIFQKYQQANNSIARNYGGTGLGLSICHSLVHMMGGTIGVDTELGQGASFWFLLPATLPTAKDLAGEADEEEGCEANSVSNTGNNPLPNECNLHKQQAEKQGLNILVAEDNKVNQKLVVKMLQRLGHTAVVAENGKEAIEMVERWGAAADGSLPRRVDNVDEKDCHPPFDICLMGIQMPVCDGFEATKRLRCMGYTGLPIYGLTASVVRSDYAELGFNDWLPKPIRLKELKVKLHQLLKLEQQEGNTELGITLPSGAACGEEKQ